MINAYESELATLRAKLDRRRLAPPHTETEYVQLRSHVMGLEDELANLTQRFTDLDHTWGEEWAALEAGKAEARSRADGLALELMQARAREQ